MGGNLIMELHQRDDADNSPMQMISQAQLERLGGDDAFG
jgi:hypothetical protein